jgi:hypothetical protein
MAIHLFEAAAQQLQESDLSRISPEAIVESKAPLSSLAALPGFPSRNANQP